MHVLALQELVAGFLVFASTIRRCRPCWTPKAANLETDLGDQTNCLEGSYQVELRWF